MWSFSFLFLVNFVIYYFKCEIQTVIQHFNLKLSMSLAFPFDRWIQCNSKNIRVKRLMFIMLANVLFFITITTNELIMHLNGMYEIYIICFIVMMYLLHFLVVMLYWLPVHCIISMMYFLCCMSFASMYLSHCFIIIATLYLGHSKLIHRSR